MTQHVVTGQTEHEVDVVGIAELHHLGAGIMTVTANGEAARGQWRRIVRTRRRR
jgi:hypothetical protein